MLQRLHFLDNPSGCNGLASTLSSLHRQCITCGNSKPDRIRAGIAIPTETMRTSLNEPILPNNGV